MWSLLKVLGISGIVAVALFNMGEAAIAQNRVTSPKVLAQADTSRKADADRRFKQGTAQVDRNENDAALKSLQQSLAIYQTLGDRIGQMEALRYIGLAYQQLGQYHQALQYLQRSRLVAQEIGDHRSEVKALIISGDVRRVVKETDMAIADYEQARSIAMAIPDSKLEALVLENLRHFYDGPDDRQAAIAFWQKNLAIYQEKGIKIGESLSLIALSLIYYDLKDYQKSVEYHRQNLIVVAAAQKQNTQSVTAAKPKTLQELYSISLLENGIELICAEKREEMERALNQPSKQVDQAPLLGILSHCYEKGNQLAQSIDYKQRSLRIAQQNKLRLHEGLMRVDLGKSYQAQGDFTAARKSVEQGVMILRELSIPQWEVWSLDTLAQIYATLAEHRLAINAQTEALTLAQRHNVRLPKPGFKIAPIQNLDKSATHLSRDSR